MRPRWVPAALAAFVGAAVYGLTVRGDLTVDLRLGRRVRPLGPFTVDMDAPRETVFDVIAMPYLGRATRAMADKIEVLERGSDMVLAAHRTRVGRWFVTTTVETVRFEAPERVGFRLLRGPVPHVVETFTLRDAAGSTELTYAGELGTDLWRVGQWWGDVVATTWEATVRSSLEGVRDEAERRSGR